jgi:tetratricopeptide (TPR) repeat protein
LGEGQVLNDLGNIYQALGRWTEAADCYVQALPMKRQYAQSGDLAATLNNLAVNQSDRGEPARALETLDEALALYRGIDHFEGVGQTLVNQGNFLGRLDEAEVAYCEAVEALTQAQAQWEMPSALNGLGNVHRRRGNLTAALDAYHQSLEAAQAVGDLTRQEQAIGNMGLLVAKGRFPTLR